jgi:aryl-alcohol dehydrogenase-like predicted oxidoreductase
MIYGKVAGIDKPVSRIVFGTDRLRGRRRWWLPDRSLEKRAFSLLDKSFDLGCNVFDTARIYGDAERTLGAWMRSRANRDKIVIISKGCHPHFSGPSRLSPSDLSSDLHASLRALGADYIDLYLLHFDDPNIPAEPIVERLNRHIAEGKIRAIGTSNWSHERIASANAFATRDGLKPFCASSIQFSLAEWTRPPWSGSVTIGGNGQRAARDWYGAHDLSLFAWSSLARGFFSSHYDPEKPNETAIGKWCATYFGTSENLARLERARKLARERRVTVAQVALAYVLGHPLHIFAVVGCTTFDKFAEDVGALSLVLDGATLRWLSSGDPD